MWIKSLQWLNLCWGRHFITSFMKWILLYLVLLIVRNWHLKLGMNMAMHLPRSKKLWVLWKKKKMINEKKEVDNKAGGGVVEKNADVDECESSESDEMDNTLLIENM